MTTVRVPAVFANNGTVSPIDVTRTDGVVNFNQGYTDDYSRELGVDPSAKAVERDKLNYLFNLVTANLSDWQESAAPQWITSIAYKQNAYVRYTPTVGQPEKIYRCLQDVTAGVLPTNLTYWEETITTTAMQALIPMITRGNLTVATDFNGIGRGWWNVAAAISGASAHSPSSLDGVLACYPWAGTAGTDTVQVYYAVDGTTYSRGLAGGVWSDWKSNVGAGGLLPVTGGGTGLGAVPSGNFVVGDTTTAMKALTPAQALVAIGAAALQHTHPESDVINLTADLATKAPINTPTFTNGAVINAGALANTASAGKEYFKGYVTDINVDGLRMVAWRTATPDGGWGSVYHRLERIVDSQSKAWIDFGGDSTNPGFCLRFGQGATQAGFISYNNTWLFSTAATFQQKVTMAGEDNVFSGSGPLQFTGMGANASIYWHGLNGPGDNLVQITRQNTNSAYIFNWFGQVNASQWFNYSDRRLKFNIKKEPVTRGIAYKIALHYKSWQMKVDGAPGRGNIAQDVQKWTPHHVKETKLGSGKKGAKEKVRLVVDNTGMNTEAIADLALENHELKITLANLLKRIEKLEAR